MKKKNNFSSSSSFPLPPVKPNPEQVSVSFDPDGEKSYSLPYDKSGLTYDYWG